MENNLTLFLKKTKTWIKARKIAEKLRTSPREIRHMANDASGTVISGNNGYIHIDYAEAPDVRRFVMRNQNAIDEIQKRLNATRKLACQVKKW